LVQDLPANFEFELSPPYLLYRVGNQVRDCRTSSGRIAHKQQIVKLTLALPACQVHGLWFYEDAEGVRMNDLLQRCGDYNTVSPFVHGP